VPGGAPPPSIVAASTPGRGSRLTASRGAAAVYVRRGGELEPVGEVQSSDADYDTAVLALMDRARERVAVLNSERGD
jgi:hypothetical protein